MIEFIDVDNPNKDDECLAAVDDGPLPLLQRPLDLVQITKSGPHYLSPQTEVVTTYLVVDITQTLRVGKESARLDFTVHCRKMG